MSKLKMKRFPGGAASLFRCSSAWCSIPSYRRCCRSAASSPVWLPEPAHWLVYSCSSVGATIDIKSTPKAIKIGAVIIGTKVAMSVILGLGVAFLFGDNFLGLSSLAIISAVSVANNALYSGIVSQYDDDAVKGAVAITSLSVGPTVTMIALSSARSLPASPSGRSSAPCPAPEDPRHYPG